MCLNQAVVQQSGHALSEVAVSNFYRLLPLDLTISFLVNRHGVEEVKLGGVWWNYIHLDCIAQLVNFKSQPLCFIFISALFVRDTNHLHLDCWNFSWVDKGAGWMQVVSHCLHHICKFNLFSFKNFRLDWFHRFLDNLVSFIVFIFLVGLFVFSLEQIVAQEHYVCLVRPLILMLDASKGWLLHDLLEIHL